MVEKVVLQPWVIKLIESLISVIISFTIYKILTYFLFKKLGDKNLRVLNNKKTKTYIKLLKSITRYIFIIATALIVLQINGINVSSMVAGVGIISIIIGFAIQDALKDIIKGFDIISDNYYQVGDVIKYKDNVGKVLAIGLKTTKIEDVYSLNIVSISNRNIEHVEVVSNLINIDIPLPYELKTKDAIEVINKIINEIKKNKDVINCEYRGVNDLASSSINYQIKVYTDPVKKVQIRRDVLSCIVKTLEENNIAVPYNKLDVYQK